MPLQALRGTTDILNGDVLRWTALERTARHLAARYGYQEIRTPVLEDATLFRRSIGETSDIVQKEMFEFEDRGGHRIVLRPEGTAPVVRAYLEHHLDKTRGFAKLFYLGPMFRAERPQAGRFRQFHQFGTEAIGSDSPWVDAEAIALCVRFLEGCGVKDLSVWLSSMGSRDDQARSAQALRERLAPHRASLCKECQSRIEKNVFRVLDCKHPDCRALAWEGNAKPFLLGPESQQHFDQVRRGLEAAGIAFDDSQTFARGLDYYTRTVFEVRAAGLGAQDAVAAGGRYDRLVEELGGPALPAFGFAAGLERVLLAAGGEATSGAARRGIFLAVVHPDVTPQVFRLAQSLRGRGLVAALGYEGKSLKSQLREADKSGFRYLAVIGPEEIKNGRVTVKDLEQGQEAPCPLDSMADALADQLVTGCRHQTTESS